MTARRWAVYALACFLAGVSVVALADAVIGGAA